MARTDTSSVRIGTPDDVDGMMQIAIMGSDENGFIPANPVKLLGEIWPALNKDRGLVGIIGKPGEQIEAAVLLRLGDMWYSDSMVVEEKAIFVHPDFRRGALNRARTLFKFSKHVSDSLGLPLIIGVLSNARTEAKIKLYEREFGPSSGSFFLYGAKTGSHGRSAN